MNGTAHAVNQSRLSPIYAFGSFRFIRYAACSSAARRRCRWQTASHQLLALLIHANGNVVDKESIATSVWPEHAVSDGNLSQHVYMLRQLLAERATDRSYT